MDALMLAASVAAAAFAVAVPWLLLRTAPRRVPRPSDHDGPEAPVARDPGGGA